MKHVKLFEEWTDFLQIQADERGMTKAEFTAYFLSEAKPAEETKEETLEVAQKFADALTKVDGKEYTVSSDYEEDSFDLDVDGEEYEGGSYNINADGSVVNMAVWDDKHVSPTYGDKDDDVKTIIKKIKKLKF